MRKIFILFLALAASVGTMFAENGTCGDNLTWDLTAGVLTISGTGAMTDYKENTQPWFSNRKSISQIVIDDGITSIGKYAFPGCTGLTSVTIPNSITSIGLYAFASCAGLTSIDIPNSVTSIGQYAFADCTVLTSIEIPNSVTSIGDAAFYDCSSLTSIAIPNSITSIEDYAFNLCNNLTSVTIPNSVTSIGYGAFYKCTGLTSIEIPYSVTSIGCAAFADCSSLFSITSEAVAVPTLAENVFQNVNKSIPLYVPAESIEAYQAANQWKEFTNIQAIPGTEPCVSASGTCGAEGDNLTWELSCDGVLTISGTGEMVNYGNGSNISPWESNTSIQSIIFEEGVSSVGTWAFSNCSGITSVSIPSTMVKLEGWGATVGLSNVRSVTVAPNNPIYDSRENCNAIIETATNKLARGCLTTVIPQSVTSIGYYAFMGYPTLTSIEIPDGVTSIGDYAFTGCSGLTSITCKAVTPPALGTYVFPSVNKSSCTLYVPAESVDAYKAADQWKDFTNIQAIQGEEQTFTITWKNYDGTELQSGEVEIGAMPEYGGATPTKPAEGLMYKYIFTGWTPEIEAVTGDATYTATFERVCPIASGTCGKSGSDMFWELTCDSVLIISGEGSMIFYDNTAAPWKKYVDCIVAVEVQEGVEEIGRCAFANFSKLTSVTWPSTFHGLGARTFENCTSLKAITIPETLPGMGYSAFQGCTSLEEVHITNLPKWCQMVFGRVESTTTNPLAFAHHLYLNGEEIIDLEIPRSVSEIAAYAFYGGSSFKSLKIPSVVTGIGNYAFTDCSGLESITCEAVTPPEVLATSAILLPSSTSTSYVFTGVDKSIPVYVPYQCIAAYKSATMWKEFTNIQAIPGTEPQIFTVTWKNFDGTELQRSEVEEGVLPQYTGTTPTKPADAQYTYTFSGWAPEVVTVTGDATYTAQFGSTLNKYAVSFVNYDGTELQSGEVEYGVVPVYTGAMPSRPDDEHCSYTFSGWTPEIVAVTGDATYTAAFSSVAHIFTITWVDERGNVIKTSEVAYGELPVYDGPMPTKDATAEYTYEFAGWLPMLQPATEDARYITDFERNKIESPKYMVNINGENCSLRISNEVPAGTTLQVEAVADECFEFQGWSDNETANPRTIDVTEDADLTAEFNKLQYTITGKSENAGGHVQIQSKGN